MAKLSKVVKEDLLKTAAEKLLGKSTAEFAKDAENLAFKILEADPIYRSLMAQMQLVDGKFMGIFAGKERYTTTIRLNSDVLKLPRCKEFSIGKNGKRAYAYDETALFKTFVRSLYTVELGAGLECYGEYLTLPKNVNPEFAQAFERLMVRSEKLQQSLNSLVRLVESVTTDKQLKELAPDLFALLPSQTVKHTLMVPVDDLLTVNELFKTVA